MIDRLRAIGGSGNEKALARTALALTASLLMVGMLFASPSIGSVGQILAQASGSPSPTGPAGPTIQWLNPAPGYDPKLDRPPRPPGSPDAPKISDRNDGVDSAYHLQVWMNQVPPNAVVEAGIQYPNENEVTIGTLQPVAGLPDTWELFWDVPTTLNEGSATLIAHLYTDMGAGLEEVAFDKQPVDMQHKGARAEVPPNPMPADETLELTWPTQNGPVGFFKSSVGLWRTVVDVSVSDGTSELDILYSTSAPGSEAKFANCGHYNAFNEPNFHSGKAITVQVTCTLAISALPTDITAIAGLPLEGDQPEQEDVADSSLLTQESADVHRTQPYLQQPEKMKVKIVPTHHGTKSANYPTGRRRLAASDCLEFDVFVTDDLDRPVQGANVDVHADGPTDQVGFGVESAAGHGTSVSAVPAEHTTESGRQCDDFIDTPQNDTGSAAGSQGDHNVPGGNDIKHRESGPGGSGLSGPNNFRGTGKGAAPGMWRFALYSAAPGKTNITAWVDEEPTPADPKELRPKDDDLYETTEPSATTFAQWLPAPLRLTFEPAGGGALIGSCHRYILRARAGDAIVDGINVDVHAQGPGAELDFCDPGDGSPRTAPGLGEHSPEDTGEGQHPGSPSTQHTEGDTNDAGNFVFGITSPEAGDTTLFAWVDGEPGALDEDDLQQTTEVNATATHTWGAAVADAKIRFVNPSAYGGSGDRISNKKDADSQYHLVARTDAFEALPGVEFLISSTAGTFTKLGDATRIGETDTYEFFWNVGVADGSYTLRAQILGTTKSEDRAVTINSSRTGDPPSPSDPEGDPSFESAEITTPIDGTPAAFAKDGLKMTGFASAGAERVRLYYTRSAAGDVRDTSKWTLCGSTSIGGKGTEPQRFEGLCKLAPGDAASGVTGVAVISVDCHTTLGCQDSASAQTQFLESGDAHRIFGFAADPILSLEPAESQSQIKTCQKLVLTVQDQTGQPLTDSNVDLHLSGPNDEVSFCDVEGGDTRTPPDQGGHTGSETDESVHPDETGFDTKHTEGTTGGQGRFTVGITSAGSGDSSILVWVDANDDDVPGTDERGDSAIMHWVDPAKEPPSEGGCTKVGTPGNDVLIGTNGDDKLCGRGGNDVLRGRRGNDVLLGGRGNDKLIGGQGNDKLRSGPGRDVMRAATGRDQLNGGGGGDRLNGGGDSDACDGGRGRDKFRKCERRRR